MRALGGPQEDTWTASTGPDWSPHYHLSQPGTLQARLLGDALFPGPKPLLPLPRQQQIKRAGLLDFINVTYFSMPGRSFHLTRDTLVKLHVPSGSHMAWRLRTDWGLSGSMGLRSSPHFGGPGPPLGDTQLRFQMEGGQGRSPAASSRRPRVPPAPRRAGVPCLLLLFFPQLFVKHYTAWLTELHKPLHHDKTVIHEGTSDNYYISISTRKHILSFYFLYLFLF